MAKHEENQFAESVRKMTGEEIAVELKNLRDKLYTLRSQAVTEKVEDVSQFGKTKRNIARLLTEQSARRIAGAGEPRTPKSVGKRTAAPARKPAAKAKTAAKSPKATAAKTPRKAGASARTTKSKTAKASK